MPRKSPKLSKRNREKINLVFQKWLMSQGECTMTLNPEKFKPGMIYSYISGHKFQLFGFPVRKSVQRSFSVGKHTKVPVILADQFLADGNVILVNKAEVQNAN